MSGEMQDKYVNDLELALKNLVKASNPFTTDDLVDELTATIPFTEALIKAIADSDKLLAGEV